MSSLNNPPTPTNHPGANPGHSIAGYHVRRIVPSDFAEIQKLTKSSEFDVGMETLKLYLSTSPTTWHCIVKEATGEIVGMDSYNLLSNGVYMGYQLLISPSERGKKLTHLFNTMNYATFVSMGNATKDSIERYSFQVVGPKLLGMIGPAAHYRYLPYNEFPKEIVFEEINKTNIDAIDNYDRSVIGFERSEFLSKYILDPQYGISRSATVQRNGIIVGYGVIRYFSGYWSLSPLYADTPSIAIGLIKHLLRKIPQQVVYSSHIIFCILAIAYIHASANNRTVRETAERMKWKAESFEMRCYDGTSYQTVERNLKWSKIYGIQEYYPA